MDVPQDLRPFVDHAGVNSALPTPRPSVFVESFGTLGAILVGRCGELVNARGPWLARPRHTPSPPHAVHHMSLDTASPRRSDPRDPIVTAGVQQWCGHWRCPWS
ncbi:hypothetical protein Bbelb_377870 [Branchiostoma belcheri]|nr:hypothetical protein Bbelb_377870 [Branchiostoma belcheri]